MQIKSDVLIEELMLLTNQAIEKANIYKSWPISTLNYKKHDESWSVLECLEHLNLYGDYYLPEIEKQLNGAKNMKASPMFASGIIGNYFANLMKVQHGQIKKMKSPSSKNPAKSTLTLHTIDRFIVQINTLQLLLEQAKKCNLTKIKTAISLSPFIKLRLGDTLRFLVYHIERHLFQADQINPDLTNMKESA